MQDLDEATFGELIAAQHVAVRREWLFYMMAAALPNLPRVLTEKRSYAELPGSSAQPGRLVGAVALGAPGVARDLVPSISPA